MEAINTQYQRKPFTFISTTVITKKTQQKLLEM